MQCYQTKSIKQQFLQIREIHLQQPDQSIQKQQPTELNKGVLQQWEKASLIFSSDAGIFTAPVRGVYYFRFSAWEDRARSWIGANLYHNDKRMTWNSNYNDELGRITVTNALVLQLNKGDVVYMVLPADHGVWDDTYDRTTFSGFLLFSL